MPPQLARLIAPLVIGAFLVVLNETILNVALSSIMADYGVTASVAQWASSAYMLTMAIVIPASGFLLRRFGSRRLFIAAMSIFAVGTALAAVAPVFGLLITARVIQACGAAVMMPVLMTTVASLVAPERRGQIMGVVSIVLGAAPAIGPTVSGLGIAAFGWHGLFWATLVVAVGVLIFGIRTLPDGAPTERPNFDPLSLVLSVLGFGGLVLGLSLLESDASALFVATSLVVGVLALIGFVLRQLWGAKQNEAYLDLRTFLEPRFTLAIIAIAGVSAALFATLNLTPLLLQNVLGYPAWGTGLALLPGGLIMAVLSPSVGRLYDRFGAGPVIIPSALIAVGALFCFIWLPASGGIVAVGAIFTAYHVGLAGLFTPLMTEALGAVKPALQPDASAAFSTTQQLAGAAGTAALVGIMHAFSAPADVALDGMHAAFVYAAVLATIPLVIGFILLSKRARPSQAIAQPLTH